MADPVADNADFAVDELKRKARRRLVGAIVIALAAATVLPLLLEQEQRPLGDDVSVQIPPVDSGKFVSRLTPGPDKGPAPEPRPDAGVIKSAGEGSAPATGQPPLPADAGARPAPGAKVDANAGASDTKPVVPDTKPIAADAKSEPKGAATPAPPAAAAASETPAAATPPADAPAAEASRTEGYVVQLGAFTDKYGANALAGKLKKRGYPAFTEPVETSRGTLWRVRAGGYPTRAAAVEARNKLKADGHDGVVTAAK
jgi:DedD protein